MLRPARVENPTSAYKIQCDTQQEHLCFRIFKNVRSGTMENTASADKLSVRHTAGKNSIPENLKKIPLKESMDGHLRD